MKTLSEPVYSKLELMSRFNCFYSSRTLEQNEKKEYNKKQTQFPVFVLYGQSEKRYSMVQSSVYNDDKEIRKSSRK